MLTAVDGQANVGGGTDTFRIKIWEIDANDALVYDNKPSTADDSYECAALGGRSVVVHKE